MVANRTIGHGEISDQRRPVRVAGVGGAIPGNPPEESGYSTRLERKRQQFDPAISAPPILHNLPSAHTKTTICSSSGAYSSRCRPISAECRVLPDGPPGAHRPGSNHDSRSRTWPQHDTRPYDAPGRIFNVLAVHYCTGLFGACGYEPGDQQRRYGDQTFHFGLLYREPSPATQEAGQCTK
jgi:hypothetical protein